MDQIKIGKFIAERRKERGYLQKDIAAGLGISEKTVSKWECGNGLPEVVFMEPLCRMLGITVNELLAGEFIPLQGIISLLDMSRLELAKQLEFEQLRMRIYKLYDLDIESTEISGNGAGGLTYFVTAAGEKYVVKYPSDNEMNHPETEIRVCRTLLSKGIPACRFIPNKQGNMLSTDENGRSFTVQHYYEGVTYAYNEAPEKLQKASAVLLARIHRALETSENIPIGIGGDFFAHRNYENMRDSYLRTLQQAKQNGDNDIARAICFTMTIADRIPAYEFDINKFTCGATHGDYTISQLIWQDDNVAGIIDWTCVCKHPYIWELVRSYIFMAPEVSRGEINIEALIRYISDYMVLRPLNSYDIENAGRLFCYFLTVCNFYGQYYDSIAKNRYIYLKQAEMSTKLLMWFENHIGELNDKLCELSKQISSHKKLSVFYDCVGRLAQYPRKQSLRILALKRIAECFDKGRKYTEKEVNEIILQNISFSDYATVRRELIDFKLIGRLSDGSEYWRE